MVNPQPFYRLGLAICFCIYWRSQADCFLHPSRSLAQHGMFPELLPYLSDEEKTVRMAVAEIISGVMDFDAAMMRTFVLAQRDNHVKTLTEILISRWTLDTDLGMSFQYAEIMRRLVDISGLDMADDKKTPDFLQLFYENHIQLLVLPLMNLELGALDTWPYPFYLGVSNILCADNENDSLSLEPSESNLLSHLVEFLGFLVKSHTMKMKYFLLNNEGVAQKICLLFKAKEKYLSLGS
jgi:hypothetical protein